MAYILWSDDRVAMLKKLWGDGLSASQIAAELGGITRNSVISKVHRLGLSGRINGHADGRKKESKPGRKPSGVQISRRKYRKRLTEAAVAGEDPQFETDGVVDSLSEFDLAIPISQRKQLVDLTIDSCRWPVGDPTSPDFYFCGGNSVTGRSYCDYHCRVAYQQSSNQRGRSDGEKSQSQEISKDQ